MRTATVTTVVVLTVVPLTCRLVLVPTIYAPDVDGENTDGISVSTRSLTFVVKSAGVGESELLSLYLMRISRVSSGQGPAVVSQGAFRKHDFLPRPQWKPLFADATTAVCSSHR